MNSSLNHHGYQHKNRYENHHWCHIGKYHEIIIKLTIEYIIQIIVDMFMEITMEFIIKIIIEIIIKSSYNNQGIQQRICH